MSLKNVEKFFELVKSNKNIAEDLIKIKDKLQQKDKILDEIQFVKDEIIPLAQKNGIDFAPEEFLNYVKAQISELSDEDLLNVSGGGNFQNFLLGGLLVALSSVAPVVGISNFKLVENVAQETTQNSEINTQTSQGGDNSEAASAKAKSDAQNDGSSKKKTDSKARSSQNANKNKAAGKTRGNSLNRSQPSSHRRAPQNGSAVLAGLQGDVENLSQQQLSTPADVSAAPSVPTGSEVSQNNSVKSFTSQPQKAPTPNIKTDIVNPAPEPTPAPQPTVNSAPAPEPVVKPINNEVEPEPAPVPVVKPINNEVEPEPAPQPNIKSDPAPDPAPVPPVEPKYNDVHRGWTAERARALAIYLRNNFDLSTFSEAVLDSETENSLKDFYYNCEVTKKGTFIHGVRIDNEDAATLFSYCAEKYDYIFGTNKNIKDEIVKTFIINKDPENFVDFAESLGRDGLNDLKILVNTWREMKRTGEYTEYPQLRKDVYKSASQFISKARKLIKAKNSVNKEIKDIIQEDEAAISASSFRWQKISFWAKSLVIGTVLAYLTYKYGDTIYGFVNDIKNHVVSLFHKGTPFSNMVNDTVDHFENQCLSNGIIPTNITTNTTPLANGSNFVKNIYNIAKKSTALVDKNNATNFISTNYNPAIQENINKLGEQLISQPGSSTSVALVSQGMQKIDAPGVAQKVGGLVEYGKSIGSTVANYLTNWGSSGTNVATSVNKIATGSAVVDPSTPPSDWVGTAVKEGSSLVAQSMKKVDAPSLSSLTQCGVNTIKKAGNAISSLGGQVLDKRGKVFASIKNSLYSIVGDAPTFAKAVTDSNGMLPANLETLEKGVKITTNTLNTAAAVNPSAIASTINKGVEVAANTLKQGGSGAINLAMTTGKEALNSLVEIGKNSIDTNGPISVAKEVVDNPLAFNYGPLNMIKEAAEKSGWNFKKIGLTAVGLASSLFSVFGGGVFATRNKIHCTGAFEDYATGLSLGISNSNELDIRKYSEEIQQFIKEEMIKSLLFCNEDSAKLPAKQLNTILISSDESENNFNLAVKNLSKSSNLRSATKPYVLVPLVLKQKNDTKDRSKVTSATMNVYVDDCVCTFSWNSAKPDQINFSKPDDCPNVSEEKLENAKQLFCREIGLKNKSDNDLDVTLGTKDYSNAILSKWTSADVVSFAERFTFDAEEILPSKIFMDLKKIVQLIQIETNGIATINGEKIPEESFIKVLNIARDHLRYYDCKSSYSSSELMKFVMVKKNLYFDDETTSVAKKLKQMKNSGTFKNTPKFILEKINWVLVEAGLEKPEEPAAPADAVLPIDKEREKQEERKVTFTIPVADEKNSEETKVAPSEEKEATNFDMTAKEGLKDEEINNLDTSAEKGIEDKTVITTDEEKVHGKDKKLGGGEDPPDVSGTLHESLPSEKINAEENKAGFYKEATNPEDDSLHSEETAEEKNETKTEVTTDSEENKNNAPVAAQDENSESKAESPSKDKAQSAGAEAALTPDSINVDASSKKGATVGTNLEEKKDTAKEDSSQMILESGRCGSKDHQDLDFVLFADGLLLITRNGRTSPPGSTKLVGELSDSTPFSKMRNKDKVKKVSISNDVKLIKNTPFRDLKSVTDICITSDSITIGETAFADSPELSKLEIFSNCIKVIGKDAFARCQKLSTFNSNESNTINIPNSVTTIEEGAFKGCAFESVNMGANITSIGKQAFFNCKKLRTINFGGDHNPANGIKLFTPNEDNVQPPITINVQATYNGDYFGCAKVTKLAASVDSNNDNDFGPGPGGTDFGSGSDHDPSFEGSENNDLAKSEENSLYIEGLSKEESSTSFEEDINQVVNSNLQELVEYLKNEFPLDNFSKDSYSYIDENMLNNRFFNFCLNSVATKEGMLLPCLKPVDSKSDILLLSVNDEVGNEYDNNPDILFMHIDDEIANTLCQYSAKVQNSHFKANVNSKYELDEDAYGKPVENEVVRCFLFNESPQDIFDNINSRGEYEEEEEEYIDGLENLKALLETYKKMQGSGILAQYPQFMQDRANIFASELEQFIKEKESELNNNNDGSDSESSTGGSDFDSGSDFGPGSNGGGNNKTQQENNTKLGGEEAAGSDKNENVNAGDQEAKGIRDSNNKNENVNTEEEKEEETTPTNDNAEKFEKYNKTLEQNARVAKKVAEKTDPNHPFTPRLNKVIASLNNQNFSGKEKIKSTDANEKDETLGQNASAKRTDPNHPFTPNLSNFLSNLAKENSEWLDDTSPKINKVNAQSKTDAAYKNLVSKSSSSLEALHDSVTTPIEVAEKLIDYYIASDNEKPLNSLNSNQNSAQLKIENEKHQLQLQAESTTSNKDEQTSNNNNKKDDDYVEELGDITEEEDNQNTSKWTRKRVQDLYDNLGPVNGENKLPTKLRQELYDFFDDVEVVPNTQEMTFKVGNVSIKGAAAQRFHDWAPYSNVVYKPNASDRIKELSRYVMFSGRGTLDKMENYSNKYGKWAENSAGAKENVKAFINDFRKLMTPEGLNKLPIWEQEEFKKHKECIDDISKKSETNLESLAKFVFNQKWTQEKVNELVNAVSSYNSESDLVNEWTLINFLKNIDVDYENRSGLAFKLHVNNSNDIINVTEEQAKILRENISKHVRIWFNPIFVRDSEKISKENKIEISEKEKIKLALKCVAFNNGYRDLRLATQYGEFKLIKSKNSKDNAQNAQKNLLEAEQILERLSSKLVWGKIQPWAQKMANDFTWSQERVNNVFTLIEKKINGISSVKVIPKEQKEISQFVNNLVILGKSEKPKFAIGIKYILDEQAQTIIDLKGKVNLDITFNPYAKDKEMEALRCTTLSPDFLSMQGNLANHFGNNSKKVNEVLVDFLDTLINVQNNNTVSKYNLWVQKSFNKYIESITTYLNVENLKGAKEKLTAESSNLK